MFSTNTNKVAPYGVEFAQKYFCEIEQKGKAYPIDKIDSNRYILAYICKKLITGAFGFTDQVYYYIVYRKSWNKWWCSEDKANLVPFERRHELGESIQNRILQQLLFSKHRSFNICALVVATPETHIDTKKIIFHYLKMDELVKWSHKHGGVYDSEDGEMVGLPQSIFSTRDPWV